MAWYLGMRNPSRTWRRDPGRDVVFDVKECTVSGVPVGAQLERMSFLGPGRLRRALPPSKRWPMWWVQLRTAWFDPDHWNSRIPYLEYPRLGVRVYFGARDKIVGFALDLRVWAASKGVERARIVNGDEDVDDLTVPEGEIGCFWVAHRFGSGTEGGAFQGLAMDMDFDMEDDSIESAEDLPANIEDALNQPQSGTVFERISLGRGWCFTMSKDFTVEDEEAHSTTPYTLIRLEFWEMPPSPVRHWKKNEPSQVVFDLDTLSLCGATLGSHYETLADLGQPYNWSYHRIDVPWERPYTAKMDDFEEYFGEYLSQQLSSIYLTLSFPHSGLNVHLDEQLCIGCVELSGEQWDELTKKEYERDSPIPVKLLCKGEEFVGSSRVDLQACKLEYSIVSPK